MIPWCSILWIMIYEAVSIELMDLHKKLLKYFNILMVTVWWHMAISHNYIMYHYTNTISMYFNCIDYYIYVRKNMFNWFELLVSHLLIKLIVIGKYQNAENYIIIIFDMLWKTNLHYVVNYCNILSEKKAINI